MPSAIPPGFSPFAPRFLASLASYSPAHTSDTTAPALLNEFLTQVHAIGQEHIGGGAPVLAKASLWSVTSSPYANSEAACFARLP